ncbi:MAG: arabinan endo-1,5-alpha-L-arabinosidase [Bacteroides sp.]|nr:arabinan endo-1,5-alpha-L-arabinosidase [Bacteroides sp.]
MKLYKSLFFSVFALAACCMNTACSGGSDDAPTQEPENPTPTVKPETNTLDSYVAPTYVDDYTSIAAWGKRSQWNLANVHDPTVVLAEDGYYYMYQTDASYGNAHEAGGHFHGRRSKDLVNWEYLGGTMKDLPDWVIPKLNEIRKAMGLSEVNPDKKSFGYWAPCVRKVKNGLYRMYYSIVCPGYIDSNKTSWGERAFIGMMENTDPSNNNGWVDKGYVITNASDKNLNFYVKPDNWANCYFKWNAIDPCYIITPEGKHWLIYGSWHSGFPAIELDASTGKPAVELPNPWGTDADIAPYGKLVATRQMGNRWQGSEGPEVIYNPATGYYYLFVAYDALDIPYNTRVVRSKNVDGPYVGIDGTDVTNKGGEMYPILTHPYKFNNGYGWVGISHCCVFDDGKGNWYYASQARFPANVGGNAYSNAIMMGHVRSIRWTEDGWPLVMPERYGAVPQVAITEEELVGNWEHIDLGYSYGNQKKASVMTLSADHKITVGTWKGSTWSFNATKQILTANGVDLYVQREVDWEASPRRHTIVYVGLNNTKTYWGKKVD